MDKSECLKLRRYFKSACPTVFFTESEQKDYLNRRYGYYSTNVTVYDAVELHKKYFIYDMTYYFFCCFACVFDVQLTYSCSRAVTENVLYKKLKYTENIISSKIFVFGG